MQIVKVIESVVPGKYSSNLYDWRRDSLWRVTIAIYDTGMVEIPSRPPIELKTRYFKNLEEAFNWVKKRYGINEDSFQEKRRHRFLTSDPCEPPQGGSIFFRRKPYEIQKS